MQTTDHSKRRGQILIISPVLVIALAGVCALAIDVGHMAVLEAELQNAADAAALAAAQTLLAERASGWDEDTARQRAEQEGITIHEANCPGSGREIRFGVRQLDGSYAPAGSGDVANMVRVVGYRSDDAPGGPVDTFFAGILGVGEYEVGASAGVAIDDRVRGVKVGLSPFAVPEEKLVPPGQEMTSIPAETRTATARAKARAKAASRPPRATGGCST